MLNLVERTLNKYFLAVTVRQQKHIRRLISNQLRRIKDAPELVNKTGFNIGSSPSRRLVNKINNLNLIWEVLK